MIAPMEPRPVPSPDVADEVRRAFGSAVAVARRRRKLSQRQFAERAQIDRARLSRIEAGKGDVTIEIQWRIARALGMTVPQLWEKAAAEDRELRAAALRESENAGQAELGPEASVEP